MAFVVTIVGWNWIRFVFLFSRNIVDGNFVSSRREIINNFHICHSFENLFFEYSMYFWNHVPGMQLIRPNGSAIILELSSLSIRDGFTYPRSSFICDEFNCDDAMARPRRSTSLMELKRTFLNYKLKKKRILLLYQFLLMINSYWYS